MSWQPIDTAPRDGTRILLYAPGIGVVIARWAWVTAGEQNYEGDGWLIFECEDYWYTAFWRPSLPTLWMPVPTP